MITWYYSLCTCNEDDRQVDIRRREVENRREPSSSFVYMQHSSQFKKLEKTKTSTEHNEEQESFKENYQNKDNKEIALVERNNGNMYLGILEDTKLTFTKTIVGKVKKSFKMKNSSYIIKRSDVQTIDTK
ncbi:uncharacterized protein LOC127711668 [Mytilus californianus]|uniref:uncharacterized protein LOC127711668 n=1 Tax=Mytilus californianus TaxID=6549 RepID=UPI0022461911|nr:uncharacterized protein LOC127711668 [Mytilus californianus]